jgi:hypothetical protein
VRSASAVASPVLSVGTSPYGQVLQHDHRVGGGLKRGPVRCGQREQVHGILLGIPGEQGHQVAAQGVAELPGAAEAFQGVATQKQGRIFHQYRD